MARFLWVYFFRGGPRPRLIHAPPLRDFPRPQRFDGPEAVASGSVVPHPRPPLHGRKPSPLRALPGHRRQGFFHVSDRAKQSGSWLCSRSSINSHRFSRILTHPLHVPAWIAFLGTGRQQRAAPIYLAHRRGEKSRLVRVVTRRVSPRIRAQLIFPSFDYDLHQLGGISLQGGPVPHNMYSSPNNDGGFYAKAVKWISCEGVIVLHVAERTANRGQRDRRNTKFRVMYQISF